MTSSECANCGAPLVCSPMACQQYAKNCVPTMRGVPRVCQEYIERATVFYQIAEIVKHEIQSSPIKPHYFKPQFGFFWGQMGFSGVVPPTSPLHFSTLQFPAVSKYHNPQQFI